MREMPRTFTTDPVFLDLEKAAKLGALNEKDRKAYNESLRIYRDTCAVMDAERTQGRAEGRADEKIDTAMRLLNEGIDINIIMLATGLSKAQVLNIKHGK